MYGSNNLKLNMESSGAASVAFISSVPFVSSRNCKYAQLRPHRGPLHPSSKHWPRTTNREGAGAASIVCALRQRLPQGVSRDRAGFPVIDLDGYSKPRTPKWLIILILGAALSLVRAIFVRRHLRKPYKRLNLAADIASFYDARSAAWESVWGEHMHHGLYDRVDKVPYKGVRAQIHTMDEMLHYAGIDLAPHHKILDVGCGIGGASRYLALKGGENCDVTGITLSKVQADRASELNLEAGLSHRVKTEVRNVLQNDLQDDSFDLIWSLESAEHIPNKQLFAEQCKRILKPGGRLVVLAWCVRESTPPFRTSEKFSVRRIMEEFCLPRLSPPSEYATEFIRAGLRNVKYEDWTARAAPFWWEVARSAFFNPKGWRALARYGWPLIRSALAMRHVMSGIRQGVFRLVMFSATSPSEQEIALERSREVNC